MQCFKRAVCLFSIHNCTQTHVCRVSLVSVLSRWPAEGGLQVGRANIPIFSRRPAEGGLQVARANIPIFPRCQGVSSHVLLQLSFWMREAGAAESPEILG